MNDLKFYQELKYRKYLEYDHIDKVFIVKFPELPGCIAEGETEIKAIKNAEKVKTEWLKIAIEAGCKIPEPYVEPETTGRITLRLPKSTHARVVDRAKQENVSQNQLLLTYISEGLGRISSIPTSRMLGNDYQYVVKKIRTGQHLISQKRDTALDWLAQPSRYGLTKPKERCIDDAQDLLMATSLRKVV